MNELLNKMVKAYDMTQDEACEALEFTRELFEEYAKLTEKEEPYATGSIRESKTAANNIGELLDFMESANIK